MKFPLILDGATGTMLLERGMPGGVCTERWVIEHPEVLQDIQRQYVAAGSYVVYAPTFGANRIKLAQHGLGDKVAEYNRRLVEISREAVGPEVLVAGDIAPTGQFIPPVGDLPFEEMVAVYTEQAQALDDAGVDLFIVETIMAIPDARAAVLAIKSVSSKPIFVTFTVDEQGRTLTGSDVGAALCAMEALGVTAFGLNCSTGPEAMIPLFTRLQGHTSLPLICKANAGLPQTVGGKTVYHCPPEEFIACIPALAQAGVRVFGGCCGTTPDHVAALRRCVDDLGLDFTADEPFEIAVSTEKQAYYLDDVDADDCVDITCSEDLMDDLMDAEEEDETFIRLTLQSEDDLEWFEESQYAVKKPLIFLCDDSALLERALRLYQGVALYQDQGKIDPQRLLNLSGSYGLKIV